VIACGASILLENKSYAEMYFDNLSNSEKQKFSMYPIFSLGVKLGILKDVFENVIRKTY
jgi:hypothetical protein